MSISCSPIASVNEIFANSKFTFKSSEVITGGTYNLTQIDFGSYPGQLSEIVSLPIQEGSGSFGAYLTIVTATDPITMVLSAQDTNNNTIMCIQLVFQP